MYEMSFCRYFEFSKEKDILENIRQAIKQGYAHYSLLLLLDFIVFLLAKLLAIVSALF